MDQLMWLRLLFQRRWAVPLLAELERNGGAKFVTLVHCTGGSEGAVRAALEELLRNRWIKRNPGYGHPMRPEYLLTDAGARLAPMCARLQDLSDGLDVSQLVLRRWSMPIVYCVGEQRNRFRALLRRLDGITDRALALSLFDLCEGDLLSRCVQDSRPPITEYQVTPRGRQLLRIISAT